MPGTCWSTAANHLRQVIRVIVDRSHAAALVVGDNHVGADSLDQVDGVLLAGQSNGDHQNYGGRSHHHAQGSQREAHLVGAKAVERKMNNLAEHHGLFGAGQRAGKRDRIVRVNEWAIELI